MRRTQNHKLTVNYFLNGCDYDINPDIAGAKQGFYRDAKNMRLYTGKGNVKRIYGETLKYYTLEKGYTCIGAIEALSNIFEVWVSDNATSTTIGTVRFRINGVVMLQTTTEKGVGLGFSKTRRLQMDNADDCSEGLIVMTDDNDVPFLFSVTDIIDNYSPLTTKYFADFNPSLYSINLTNVQNIPVFRTLITGSLSVGKYAYALRYVDKDGNRTKFGLPTPMIPVPMNYEKGSNAHPYNSTHGGLLETSPYGIRIQFRVNNSLNYEYIEVLRIKVNTNQALDETPTAELRPLTQNLVDGEVSVWTFDDDGSYTDWEVFTDEESTDTMAAVESCKSVRFYNNHLVLGNVKLASRDLTDTITFTQYHGETAFPFIDNLGEVGYYSPHNSAYKTSYRSGELYGFGLACLDWQGNIAFVVPLDDSTGQIDLSNYQFPERREEVSAATYDLSKVNWLGIPKAADIDNNTSGLNSSSGVYVHEKFSKKELKKVDGFRTIATNDPFAPYKPYTPKAYDDSDVSGLGIRPNKDVLVAMEKNAPATVLPIDNDADFSIDYYGMGIALSGVENLPNWVKSFAVVRTKPAGRVVCQGIGTYKMTDSPQSKTNIVGSGYNPVKKSLDELCFYSDEIKQGYTGAYTNGSLSRYKFQAVSPLGYFSEVYSGREDNIVGGYMHYSGIDTMLYARNIGNEQPRGLTNYENQTLYWTKFGVWRNDVTDAFSGTTEFDIDTDINESFKGQGYDGYVKLKFTTDIYKTISPESVGFLANYMSSESNDTKNWHEPFYIGNIIDDTKSIPDINQTEYVLTGNYQKLRTIIGIGNDQAQDIPLLDERFEDCCVNKSNPIRPTYIYIKDNSTGVEKAWVDITMYSTSVAGYDQTVITALENTGSYDSADPVTGDVVTCYGAFTHEIGSSIVETGDWTIIFDEIQGLNKKYCVPANNSEIIIKYDKRFPIKVFGGDVIIGESSFALVDGESKANGDVKNNLQLYAWVGMPYAGNSIYQTVDSASSSGLQPSQYIASNIFRQIIVSSIVETPVHLPYSYQQKGTDAYNRANNFPRVNYILRPIRWDGGTINNNFTSGGGAISETYKTDYPLEYNYWGRGGFRSLQPNNIDYSKGNNYNKLFGKPQVGFTEQTEYCTRVMWSLAKNINVQDDPNLKTFLSLNNYDISDAQGEIKYLWDCDSEKGNNLYAVTANGTCLLITDKRTISDINATELFVLDADRLVKGQYWLSRNIGSNGEMWRGMAEYDNMLYIPNSESVYLLVGLAIKDILRENAGSYYERLHPVLESITDSIPIAGAYNIGNKEYWLYIGDEALDSVYDGSATIGGVDESILTPKKLAFGDITDDTFTPRINTPKVYTGETFVFKVDKNAWTGTFDYRGDVFVSSKGIAGSKKLQVLLLRNYETYDTNLGTQINGADIVGKLEFVVAPEGHILKETIDQTINSTIQPTSIELSNTVGSVEQTQTYTKNYGLAWYYQVPRKATSKVRFQGRYIIISIYNSTTGEYEINSTETGYKIIL